MRILIKGLRVFLPEGAHIYIQQGWARGDAWQTKVSAGPLAEMRADGLLDIILSPASVTLGEIDWNCGYFADPRRTVASLDDQWIRRQQFRIMISEDRYSVRRWGLRAIRIDDPEDRVTILCSCLQPSSAIDKDG
ncbi:MAG: hypothetical protein KGI69_03550 [Patescibacteria group bacterium]|nr:hypothetical protein [Patescibacteria group bacterium]